RARAELTEAIASIDPDDPSFRETLVVSELLVRLAEGDLNTALDRATALVELQRSRGLPNEIATATWWVGRVFGADVVGGDAALRVHRDDPVPLPVQVRRDAVCGLPVVRRGSHNRDGLRVGIELPVLLIGQVHTVVGHLVLLPPPGGTAAYSRRSPITEASCFR